GREDAGVDEDQRHDGEVGTARSRAAGDHRHGLQAPEASLHVATGDSAAGWEALLDAAGHAAQLTPRWAGDLRSRVGGADAGRDPGHGWGGEESDRLGVDVDGK